MRYLVICSRIFDDGSFDQVEEIVVFGSYDRAKKHRDWLLTQYPKDEIKVNIFSEDSLVKALGVIY